MLQEFKQHIEDFLMPVFRSLVCENQLCRAAAGNFLTLSECDSPRPHHLLFRMWIIAVIPTY